MKKIILLALLGFITRGYSQQTACCPGNDCGQAQNALLADHEIPMGGFNFNFNAGSAATGPSQVIIGNTSCLTTASRLDVADDNLGTGIKGFCSTRGSANIGVHGIALDPANGNDVTSIGVLGEAS